MGGATIDFGASGHAPVGQLVHYVGLVTGIHYAGTIVSGTSATVVDIYALIPDAGDSTKIAPELHTSIVFSNGWENGTWHWPLEGV